MKVMEMMLGKEKKEEYKPRLEVPGKMYPIKNWKIGDKVSFMVSGTVDSLRKEEDGYVYAYCKIDKIGDEKADEQKTGSRQKKSGIPPEAYKK